MVFNLNVIFRLKSTTIHLLTPVYMKFSPCFVMENSLLQFVQAF